MRRNSESRKAVTFSGCFLIDFCRVRTLDLSHEVLLPNVWREPIEFTVDNTPVSLTHAYPPHILMRASPRKNIASGCVGIIPTQNLDFSHPHGKGSSRPRAIPAPYPRIPTHPNAILTYFYLFLSISIYF